MSTQVEEHHTYIDGHKIAFREQGEGSPVILIHGIPTNSLMWRAIIPLLAKTRRVIAQTCSTMANPQNRKVPTCPSMPKVE